MTSLERWDTIAAVPALAPLRGEAFARALDGASAGRKRIWMVIRPSPSTLRPEAIQHAVARQRPGAVLIYEAEFDDIVRFGYELPTAEGTSS